MVVVHEVVALVLEALLDGGSGLGETLDDALDVVTLLHRDNAHLVFLKMGYVFGIPESDKAHLVDPDEQVLVVVVEDTTGIGPVAATARGEEEG